VAGDDNGADANKRAASQFHTLPQDRARPDVTILADAHSTTYHHPRGDVHECANLRVVLNDRAGIDDAALAEPCARLNDASGHQLHPRPQHGERGHHGRWVPDRTEAPSLRLQPDLNLTTERFPTGSAQAVREFQFRWVVSVEYVVVSEH
jgi:hypothetical protein